MLEGLEISVLNFRKIRELIFGSEFNSNKKQIALKKIESKKTVSNYFNLKLEIVSDISNVLSYDLTHSIGNFIHDIEVSKLIIGQRKKTNSGDFIISRLRSYLKEFAVVEFRNKEQVFSSEYLVYEPTTNEISSSSLVAFCLTKEVQTILNCSQYGTAHPRFFEFIFNELPIPNVLLLLRQPLLIDF